MDNSISLWRASCQENKWVASRFIAALEERTDALYQQFLSCENWEEHVTVAAKIQLLQELKQDGILQQKTNTR